MKTILTLLLISISSLVTGQEMWKDNPKSEARDTVPCVIVYFNEDEGIVRATNGFVVYGLNQSMTHPLYVVDILNKDCNKFNEDVTIISYHDFYIDYNLKILSNKHWGVME